VPAVPTLRTWVSGEMASAAILNSEIRDPANFYRRTPWFYGWNNNPSHISVANNVWQAIPWGNSTIDTENGYAGGSATQIAIVRAGLYEIRGQSLWATNTTGGRAMKVERIQGTSTRTVITETGMISSCSADFAGIANVETSVRLGDIGFYLDAGDRIEFFARQNSGGALHLLGHATEKWTWASARWVATF